MIPVQRSPRYDPHYCRECGAYFERMLATGPTSSPHSAEYMHRHKQHPEARTEYVACSRYCEARAQSEEIKTGTRMYGKGVTLPAPKTRYEDIFKGDDHS